MIHDGCLWIQDRIPIDATLVHRITGLSINGLNPLERVGKKYEGETIEYVRKTYHVERNTWDFIIKSISDQGTQLGTMLLACKMMRKCQFTSTPANVIQLAGQFKKGVCFNWAQYLCDEFLTNVHESQEQVRAFFYSSSS